MTGRNQIEPPSEQVTVEWRAKHVVFLEIHRPPDNYFDAELIRDLADHLERLEEHAECRAIVLASEGRNFCAGALLGSVPPPDPARIYGEAVRLFAGTKPIVAAVQGAAVGGGLGLALMADFRVASAESRFSANFSRLGYFPGFGLTGLLPRLVGEQAALFGAGEQLEVTDPTVERWRKLVEIQELPVSDPDLLWLLLRTDGQARASAQILELTRSDAPDAKWAARQVWEQESERALARIQDIVSFARAVTPHGTALMHAIAADEKPYRALRPYADAKQIARALGQLAYHGLVYSPRRGLWLLGDPLLRDALTNLIEATKVRR